MSFDLHTHSACSDGTQTPADLVAEAAGLRDTGLTGIALTDHDTIEGWGPALDAARQYGVCLVRGTEVSCETDRRTVHMLSYLQRPGDTELARELERSRTSRRDRAERMVASLAREFPITWRDVQAQVQDGASLGRPHIADALVAAGAFASRDEAFAGPLSARSRHYVPYHAPDPVRVVELIRSAGGVPVLAHGLARHRGGSPGMQWIEELVDRGLVGVEVYHREHGPAQVQALLDLARRCDLLVTGSSDYHGAGKQNRLGENRTGLETVERIATQGATEVYWAV